MKFYIIPPSLLVFQSYFNGKMFSPQTFIATLHFFFQEQKIINCFLENIFPKFCWEYVKYFLKKVIFKGAYLNMDLHLPASEKSSALQYSQISKYIFCYHHEWISTRSSFRLYNLFEIVQHIEISDDDLTFFVRWSLNYLLIFSYFFSF